jgi:ABC-type branched-subunit amino acid transport system substrate-binding protein
MTEGQPQRSAAFPPRLGWIPILIGLGVVAIASAVEFIPQYNTRQVVGVTNGGPGGQTDTGPGGASGGGAVAGQAGGAARGGAGGAAGSVKPGGSAAGGDDCAHGKNAGATDLGITATSIQIATTDVTTGIGSGFLGQAVQGMRGAIDQVNRAGGICGRQIHLESINDGWDRPTGASYISSFISLGKTFALVGEPDSEGLDAAWQNGSIDKAGIPVVGTDGMLASQYNDPWIWPVASSTVTNMHIIADYARTHLNAKKVGIVFDSVYKFGKEGAAAFKAQVQRSAGSTLQMGDSCATGYCGVSPSSNDYSSQIHDFNSYCAGAQKCDVVVMLLEPQPMGTWMRNEANCGCSWYGTLMGGEPLFDDNFAGTCGQDCARMMVWTGYKPAIQPFDGESPVYTYAHALRSVCGTCDPHNEFTEGAYLGTQLFIAACKKVGSNLTRAALRQELDSDTFDLGLSQPLHYGTNLPHLANTSMAAFQDNASGTFNGWSYLSTGFLKDPAPGQDLQPR